VYDVTAEKSFENLKDWIKLVTEATGHKSGTPIFIFGNKTDLQHRRSVFMQNEKAEEIMNQFGVVRSLEGSAVSSI
jgi:GTPase SAR1 family protein